MGKRIDVKHRLKFAKMLVVARENKRLTQKALAQLIGVSRVTVISWEMVRNYPEIGNIGKLEEVLGVKFD